jgi:hypothetical protein
MAGDRCQSPRANRGCIESGGHMLHEVRRYTRSRRLKLFNEFMKSISGPIRLVDLGGTVKFWESWGLARQPLLSVTLVNNHDLDKQHANAPVTLPNIRRLSADVLTLTVADFAQFEVIFSNSLIEHLPGRELQRQLAQAIIDSGRPYFLQTPNKRAPLDPHFPRPYVPFFATYPRPLQARLLSWSALGSGSVAPSYDAALARLRNYYPLTAGDVRRLFPQARIVVERPLGFPMSIIAMSDPPVVAATPNFQTHCQRT